VVGAELDAVEVTEEGAAVVEEDSAQVAASVVVLVLSLLAMASRFVVHSASFFPQ
jgi:hypothetical protein